MSPSELNRLRIESITVYQQMFIEALGCSAGRGGFKGNMAQMVARLSMWIRTDFAGNTDWAGWQKLMDDASDMWNQWYDWYTRFYTRPNEVLCDMSIDEWSKLEGLEAIGLRLDRKDKAS